MAGGVVGPVLLVSGLSATGACFSVAPIFGAVLTVSLLGESLSPALVAAGALMALGVWPHLRERHAHRRAYDALEHEHEQDHDVHHAQHEPGKAMPSRHTRCHRHEPTEHSHARFPDEHHRHSH